MDSAQRHLEASDLRTGLATTSHGERSRVRGERACVAADESARLRCVGDVPDVGGDESFQGHQETLAHASRGKISPATRAGLPLVALLAVLLLTATGTALAADRYGYSMEILVRGVPLQEYAARDALYIEAVKGSEYSVRLTNHTGQRTAVALSVDGLNSIDAKTTT